MGRWKIGSFTAALGCIAVGVMIVLAQFDIVSYDVLGYIWPALLILIGIEMLLRLSFKSETKTKVSGWSIVLVIVLILASGGQSLASNGLGGLFGPTQLVPVSDDVNVETGVTNVKIMIPNGKVRVNGIDGNVVSYEGDLEQPGKDVDAATQALEEHWNVETNGNTLILELKGESGILSGIHIGFNLKAPYLNVSVPRNLAVEVDTSDGSIDASDLAAGLEVHTSNGAMDIHDITGGLEAHTSNGSLTVKNIAGGAELVSSNGALSLTDIDGEVSAKSSNGKITLDSPVTGNWKCSSSNGKIEVSLPADANARVTADTSNGSLKGNVNWSKDGDSHGTATLGAGQYQVSLSTSNGSVNVNTIP